MNIIVLSRRCVISTRAFWEGEGGTQPGWRPLLGRCPKRSACLHTGPNTLKSELVTSVILGSSPMPMPGKRWACRGGRSGAGLLKCSTRKREKSQRRNRSRSWQGGSQALELSSLFADGKTLCTHERYGGKCCLWRL